MIIVVLLRGIVNKLDKKGVNRAFGTLIAYLIMFGVIALVAVFMFSPAFGFVEQIKDIISNLPGYIQNIKDLITNLYSQYSHYLENPDIKNFVNDIGSNLGNMGVDIASASANGIIAAGGFAGNFFMVVGMAFVIAFWILIELPAIGRETKKLIKPKYEEDFKIWKIACTKIMTGFIKGTFAQCAVIGLASGVFMWIVGIDNPGAFGCIIFVVNIIPIFGPIIAIIVAIIAGIFKSILMAVIAAVVVGCIQGLVYTFVSPKIMSDSCNIHPVLTLLCLTAGGAVGALMGDAMGSLCGMILAIPFVAVFKSLFIYYYEKRTGRCIVSKHGFFFKGVPYEEGVAHPYNDALAVKKEKTKKNKDK